MKVTKGVSTAIDGGVLFGTPLSEWKDKASPNKHNKVVLWQNILFIKVKDGYALVDPSFKIATHATSRNSVAQQIRQQGIDPKDVRFVIFTHFHSHVIASMTYSKHYYEPVLNRFRNYERSAFPEASVIVQKGALEEALSPPPHKKHLYDASSVLEAKLLGLGDKLKVIDGNYVLNENVELILTGGHTSGHQVVQVTTPGSKLVYAGEVLPTFLHHPPTYISGLDRFPEETVMAKGRLLRESDLIIFGYSLQGIAAYFVKQRHGMVMLKPERVA